MWYITLTICHDFYQVLWKCLYFWLNYIRECSTLMFSAKNGKVFIFLVKLYKRVFHPNVFSKKWKSVHILVKLYKRVFHPYVFSHTVNFSSLWGWEGDWSPTGHHLVALPYFMCGDWSHCMMHCLSIVDWQCWWQLLVCCHQRIHECPSQQQQGCTLLSNEVF